MDSASWASSTRIRELLFNVYDGMDQSWRARANCRGMPVAVFYPGKNGAHRAKDPKRICRGCEVKQECLDFALATSEKFGIWGELSEKERRRYKRRQVS